jgi:hypothetical protein
MDVKLHVLKQEERREFNRRMVLLVHALAGFFTAFIYLSQVNLPSFQYSQRRGLAVLLVLAPPLLPYIISAVHSWRTATYDRLRVAMFLLVLLLGAFGTGCAIVGAFGLSVNRSEMFWTFAIQAALYFFAGEFLFDVDKD